MACICVDLILRTNICSLMPLSTFKLDFFNDLSNWTWWVYFFDESTKIVAHYKDCELFNFRDIWRVSRCIIESSNQISIAILIEDYCSVFLFRKGLHIYFTQGFLFLIDNFDLSRLLNGLNLQWSWEISETLRNIRSGQFNAHIEFMEFFRNWYLRLDQSLDWRVKRNYFLMIWLHETKVWFFFWQEWISTE